MLSNPSTPHGSPQRLIPLWEGRAVLLTTGICLTLLIALLVIFPPVLVQQAELRIYDLLQAGRAIKPQSGVPVIIGIDDESLKTHGQWPWPRYRLATLVKRLHDLGATVVTLDFLMPEYDRTSPEVIQAERLRDRRGGSTPLIGTQEDSNSHELATAIAAGATALGCYVNFNTTVLPAQSGDLTVPPGMVVIRDPGNTQVWPQPEGILRSIPLLTDAAGSEGFTNARHDCDGALRRVPLLLFKEGRPYPSLALASLLLASDHRTLRLTQAANETTLIWGERRIPLDSQGNLLVDFRSHGQPFPYISARSILTNSKTPVNLKGKIVLVGAWARGLGDSHIVPSGQSLNGLAIHATVIDNILSGTFINRPSWGSGAELSAILFLGLACTWLFSQPGFIVSLATVAVGVAGSFGGSAWLLASKGLYLSPLLPMLTPIVLALFLGLLKYGIESRKVQQRTLNLIEAQDAVILGMSALTAARDKETGGHILRTQRYVETLARQLASTPRYHTLDETNIELLVKSAPLHDIGKVGIPDNILQKAGSLTEQEYAIMKTHTLIGSQALLTAISSAIRPEHLDFLNYARQMTESHHESWDGSGYPHGLRGDAIPLAGRLMSLADVYDAMTIRRRYQESIPHETTRDYIVKNAGIRFDPDVVAAFVATCETFQHIAHEYADESAAAEASA